MNFVVNIDELTFGSVLVEGSKHRRDVLLLADGTVKKRRSGFSIFGSHEIREREPEKLSHEQPEVIIVDSGTDGVAHIATEAEIWAKANKVSLLVQPSYDASVKLNELTGQKKTVTGLIHITC